MRHLSKTSNCSSFIHSIINTERRGFIRQRHKEIEKEMSWAASYLFGRAFSIFKMTDSSLPATAFPLFQSTICTCRSAWRLRLVPLSGETTYHRPLEAL